MWSPLRKGFFGQNPFLPPHIYLFNLIKFLVRNRKGSLSLCPSNLPFWGHKRDTRRTHTLYLFYKFITLSYASQKKKKNIYIYIFIALFPLSASQFYPTIVLKKIKDEQVSHPIDDLPPLVLHDDLCYPSKTSEEIPAETHNGNEVGWNYITTHTHQIKKN